MSNRIKIKIDLKAEKPKIIKQFNTSKCSSLIENQSSILSLLKNKNKRRNSAKTAYTNLCTLLKLDYDFKDIKRFDEINNSLSDISEFDLEKDHSENKSEFNSSEEDINDYEEEIKFKIKLIYKNINYDKEYEIEIEREYEQIINELSSGKNM